MVVLSGCVYTSGQKLPTGGSGSYYLYYTDNRLRGHEVVVASNNNRQRNITYIGCFSAQLTSEDS